MQGLIDKGKFGSKPVVAVPERWADRQQLDPLQARLRERRSSRTSRAARSRRAPTQSVPGWDNQKARTIFEQMLSRTGNKIDAVAAANDGLANAAITALKAKKLKPIPTSGQDATAQGVQNMISFWQSGTVYKSIKAEANAAAALAISLLKGKPTGVNGKTFDGKRQVPSVLLRPVLVTKDNYTILFNEGFLKKSEVCNGIYKKYC